MEAQGEWLFLLHLVQDGAPKHREFTLNWTPPDSPHPQRGAIKKWTSDLVPIDAQRLRPQPEVVAAIFRARSVAGICRAWRGCKIITDRFEQRATSETEYAKAALDARNYRFPVAPKSRRPSSGEKRLLHLAAAMAGAEHGRAAATAIRKLGGTVKGPHKKDCHCAGCYARRWEEFWAEAIAENRKWADGLQSRPPMGMFLFVPEK